MRQMISGFAAALAVMTAGAAPAMACGGLFGGCSPCGAPAYVSPCAPAYVPAYGYAHTGCYTGCGWGFERLTDPVTQYHSAYHAPQYYYVDQGPTYTGPGAFAPYPAYEEAVEGPAMYGYHHHRRHHWREHGYYHGRPVLRRYY